MACRQVAAVVVLVAFAGAGTVSASGDKERDAQNPAVALNLAARFAMAPASMRGLVRVPAHTDKRLLRVSLDSDSYSRSSDVQLDGAGGRKSHMFFWQGLPQGTYDVVVTVFGSSGPRARVVQRFSVIGPSDDIEFVDIHAAR